MKTCFSMGLKMIKQNFYNSPHVCIWRGGRRGYIGHDSTLNIRIQRSQNISLKSLTRHCHGLIFSYALSSEDNFCSFMIHKSFIINSFQKECMFMNINMHLVRMHLSQPGQKCIVDRKKNRSVAFVYVTLLHSEIIYNIGQI